MSAALQYEQGARDEIPAAVATATERVTAGMSSRLCLLVQRVEQSLYVSAMITVDPFERYCVADGKDSKANSVNIIGISGLGLTSPSQ